MDNPARWAPVSGPLFPLFEEEGPTEWIEHPPHAGVEPGHALIEDEWPTEEVEEHRVEPAVVEDPAEWIEAWRQFATDTPIMRAVLTDPPADEAREEAA